MRFMVKVKPRAARDRLVPPTGGGGRKDAVWLLETKAPAAEGKANEALYSIIAAHFGVSKSKVRIIRGTSARMKFIEVI